MALSFYLPASAGQLSAGQGDVGFEIAAVLGESGRLISSDFSPAMAEIARRRSAELGLTNVEHRILDAEQIELADDSVDGVLCRWGYMLMPDPAAALAPCSFSGACPSRAR